MRKIIRFSCLLLFINFALLHAQSSESEQKINLELLSPFVYESGAKCSPENGCLILSVIYEDVAGTDILGNFTKTRIDATTNGGAIIALYTKEYDKFTIFEQVFETGISGTSTGNKDAVSTAWPVFRIPNATLAPGLRYVTPGGYMSGWTLYAQGSIEEDMDRFRYGEHGGIVGLIEPGDAVSRSVVISALTEPMSANVELVRGENLLQWGIQGLAESIPADYSIQIIIVYDEASFNRNVMKWGELLKKFHNTFKINDFTVDYIGYWTDNGASHYYNPLPYLSFQNMILDIYNYSVINEIPFRYVQLDSWWYYKGEEGGLKNWTARPEIFPDGIEYINSVTGWPILAHNRYFSNDTDYAEQNGGDYPFTIDQTTAKALPLDKRFWDDLFDDAKLWGLQTYEQDWLDRQYEGTSALHTNVTLGSWWLNSMGLSAAERDLAIQYCMSFPRHALHSVMLPAVTQIRVSDDYILTPNQWRIGPTSLFAHALGLKPYKDNFWSSRENVNIPFNDCELVLPYDIDHPFDLRHSYGGRKNVTKNGDACVPWTTFGYDLKYPHSGMRINVCRNPQDIKRGSYCFTNASFDTPEEEWIWEFCDPPVCQVDCFTFNGIGYIGSYGMTQSGLPCVNWNGEYGLNGTKCRNPTFEEGTWCYVTEDHSQRDFCDNKCVEAVEPNSELQSAVSTLSTGPVGLGDRAENLNRDLILKSCRSDGLILKPSKPLTSIDLAFISSVYREVWTSQSDISGFEFGIIFMAEIDTSLSLSAFDLNLMTALSVDVVLFQNYPQELTNIQTYDSGEMITFPSCGGYMNFCIFYTSPLISVGGNRTAILGETDKWSVVSPQRIKEILIGSDLSVVVSGATGDQVSIAFWSEEQQSTFIVNCNFITSDDMTIAVATQVCM